MGFLDKLFGKKPIPAPAAANENNQLVRIEIPLLDGGFGSNEERDRLFELEDELADLLANSGQGELDGNEIGGGEYSIWLYGPSAQRLFDLIRPQLPPMPQGTKVFLRHGDVDDESAREETIEL